MTILSSKVELVDMEADAYHAAPALGSTDLKCLLRSPAHYRARKEGLQEETEALRIGKLIHECILEPDTWALRRTFPNVNKRTKGGKEALAEFHKVAEQEGWLPVDAADRALCEGMRDSVMQHRLANQLTLALEAHEQSVFWCDEHDCKSRFDGIGPGFILDLKSAQDASPGAFRNAVARYDYHVQAAHYSSGYQAVTGEWPEYALLAVEKKPPYACAVYKLDDEAMSVGVERRQQALDRFGQCMLERRWPAYPETVQTLSLPNWAKQEW